MQLMVYDDKETLPIFAAQYVETLKSRQVTAT